MSMTDKQKKRKSFVPELEQNDGEPRKDRVRNNNNKVNIFSIESILRSKNSELEYSSSEEGDRVTEDCMNDDVNVDSVSSERDEEDGLDGDLILDTDNQDEQSRDLYSQHHCNDPNGQYNKDSMVLMERSGGEDVLGHIVKPFPMYSAFPNIQPIIPSASSCSRKF
jgi:hypothetical protein